MAKSKSKKRCGYNRKAPSAPIQSLPETPVRSTALPYPVAAATLSSYAAAIIPSLETAAETLPSPKSAASATLPPPFPPPAAAATIPSPAHVDLIENNPDPQSLKNI